MRINVLKLACKEFTEKVLPDIINKSNTDLRDTKSQTEQNQGRKPAGASFYEAIKIDSEFCEKNNFS
jgi:hypothetical protein